jgi:TRAP transporter TAXI family solute receptor
MLRKSTFVFMLTVLVCISFFAGIPANSVAAGEPVQLKLASFKIGSGWYVMGGAMADVIRKGMPAGSMVDALPKSGGVGNPKLISAKKADLGFAFPITANWAWNGKFSYTEKIRNIRAIAGGLDTYWILGAVKADSDIKSLRDIKDKRKGIRLATQSKGSLSEVGASQILGEIGVTYDDLESWGGKVLMKGFKEMVPALKEGAIEGFLMMATPNHPTWTEAAISRPLRFISLDEALITQMGEKYGYTRSVVPAGMFEGQDEDVTVLGFPSMLIVREDLPEDVVYNVLKSVVEGADRIASSYKAFEVFDPKTAWKPEKLGGLPLHPGAIKFYKEKGWMK